MKKLLFTLLGFYLLMTASCSRNNQRSADFLKATFKGVTHNYNPISLNFLGVSTGIGGVESALAGITIDIPNNVSGTYPFDYNGSSNFTNVDIVYNDTTFESYRNGSIVATFTSTNVSGIFSGYFMLNGGTIDSTYVTGSFSINR